MMCPSFSPGFKRAAQTDAVQSIKHDIGGEHGKSRDVHGWDLRKQGRVVHDGLRIQASISAEFNYLRGHVNCGKIPL